MHVVLLALAAAALSLPSAPADAREVCEVSSRSGELGLAKELFAESCPGIVRRDCDPTPDGGWLCSSAVIENGVSRPTRASIQTAAPTMPNAPVTSPAADRTPIVTTREPAEGTDEVCEVLSPSGRLDDAKRSFAAACPDVARLDCDPMTGGGWMCSSAKIVNGVSVRPVSAVTAFAPAPKPEPTAPVAEPAPPAAPSAEPVAAPAPSVAPSVAPVPPPVAVAAPEPEGAPEPATAPDPVPATANPFLVVDTEAREPTVAERPSVAESIRDEVEQAPPEPLAAAQPPAEPELPTHDENGVVYCDP